MREANSRIDRIASSLPGITKSISSGSQLVSTIAITGMPSLLASATAMSSRLGSTTNSTSGRPSMSRMPERLRCIFSRSRSRRSFSFLVSGLSSSPRRCSSSLSRWIEPLIVT